MIDGLLRFLGGWSRLAESMPWRSGLVGLALTAAAIAFASSVIRGWLEARSDRVAAGPIFAISGLVVLAVSVAWWAVDALLIALDQPMIAERVLLLLAPESALGAAAALRELLGLPPDSVRLLPPGPVHLPIAVIGAAGLYLILVIWAGRALAEMTALEQKPEDVLARERAEQQKAIALAIKEGRPVPTTEVVSVPLADDLFGRTFKLLGHWTSVELVEERFVRWQGPLVAALFGALALSLPAALAGHIGPVIWAGAAIALDGLRRNLKTKQAAPAPPPPPPSEQAPADPPLPPLRPLIEAIHRDAGPLLYAPALPPPQPALISPGTDLKAKKVLDELRKALPFEEGLLTHQGLACDAFAARKNVLIATPPLSGQEALCDLLTLYTLLVEGESVLYLAPDVDRARRAEARLRARAEAARWRWNVHAETIAGRTGSIDLTRSQPGLVFADPAAVHRDLCGKQGAFSIYLSALGLVVMPDLDEHHGPMGAHLAHVLRRLRRAALRASPARADDPKAGERIRFLATATPQFRDLGRFAERLVGRPVLVLGSEVDGAPQPDRAAYVLSPSAPRGDLHPAVQALGEALAQGFAAELFGYEDTISTGDVTRANEIMLARGVATRGRAFAEEGGQKAPSEALADAQVIIARASAARYASLPLLASHLGWRRGVAPKTRIAALGAGEHVGRAAAGKLAPPEEKKVDGEASADVLVTEEAIAAADLDRKVLLLLQPDLEPFAALLATERPPPSHPDLKLGCALVADPTAARVQRAHLRCALTEGETAEGELARDFSKDVLAAELSALGFTDEDATGAGRDEGAGDQSSHDPVHNNRSDDLDVDPPRSGEGAGRDEGDVRLIVRSRRAVDPVTGSVRVLRTLELTGDASAHTAVALDASGPAVSVVDRHTGDVLFGAPRERALSVVYPGRIFVVRGRRFSVMPMELQDAIAEGRVACEREERHLTTSKIRRLSLAVIERRARAERRGFDRAVSAAEAKTPDRRRGAERSIGGAPFTLELVPVRVSESVLGLRRHGPDAKERDATLYPEPIEQSFATRAAIVGFPKETFGELDEPTLHALTHLFRSTLPAFVHHREDDLEVEWLASRGPSGAPAVAFIDGHPGAVGFADAITLEVVRQVIRWSLALTRRCTGACRSREGCPRCLRITRCHAEPERAAALDKQGADRLLAAILGEAEAKTFGPPPAGPLPA